MKQNPPRVIRNITTKVTMIMNRDLNEFMQSVTYTTMGPFHISINGKLKMLTLQPGPGLYLDTHNNIKHYINN